MLWVGEAPKDQKNRNTTKVFPDLTPDERIFDRLVIGGK